MYLPESYTATEGQSVFTFTFPVLSAAHMVVTVNDANETDWTLTGPQEVTFGGTVNLVAGDTVGFARSTPIGDPLVDFTAPSSIRAREINLAISQLLYSLQEQDAVDLEGLKKSVSGTSWNGEDLPIKNLGEPTDDTDAATRGWVNGQIVSSGQLPPTGSGDAGKHLAVNATGTGFIFEAPDQGAGGVMMIPVSTVSNTQSRQRGGPLAGPKAFGFFSNPAMSCDLDETFKVPFDAPQTLRAFVDAPTWDNVNQRLTLPANKKYRLKMSALAHNLLVSGNEQYTDAAHLQITNVQTLQPVAAQTACGGRLDGLQASGDTHTVSFVLDAVVDTSGAEKVVDVRFAHYNLSDLYALDVPTALYVEEL